MKTMLIRGILFGAAMSLTLTGYSDTLILKDGTEITGYYEGGTSRVIRFETPSGSREFDLLNVREIRFGGDVVPSTPTVQPPPTTPTPATAPSVTTVTDSQPPRLQTPEESARPVSSDNAANTAFTIPRGEKLLIRTVDVINSEVNKAGDRFRATLAEPLSVGGLQVVPANSEIRGRIVDAQEAGRVSGSAQLRLELTQLYVNGIAYSVQTSEYAEAAEGRGAQTGRRVGIGAGIGAAIGAIAGGGTGAAIGAGVGAGTAGAVQVLTRGEKLNIPAETLLEFTLSEPLSVAAR